MKVIEEDEMDEWRIGGIYIKRNGGVEKVEMDDVGKKMKLRKKERDLMNEEEKVLKKGFWFRVKRDNNKEWKDGKKRKGIYRKKIRELKMEIGKGIDRGEGEKIMGEDEDLIRIDGIDIEFKRIGERIEEMVKILV